MLRLIKASPIHAPVREPAMCDRVPRLLIVGLIVQDLWRHVEVAAGPASQIKHVFHCRPGG